MPFDSIKERNIYIEEFKNPSQKSLQRLPKSKKFLNEVRDNYDELHEWEQKMKRARMNFLIIELKKVKGNLVKMV